MRILLLSLLLLPARAWSIACTGATITANVAGNTYNCDSLTIGPGTYNFQANADPVRVIVTGDVVIQKGAVLNLRGKNGVKDAAGGALASPGGPGAGDGGGNGAGPENSPDVPNGGTQGDSNVTVTAVCGGGGGGGGFKTDGKDGTGCSSFNGGQRGFSYDITVLFRGGFGGGAGGTAEGNNPLESGTGGGGGGAIWISADGNITINGNIDVRGGNGGAGAAFSGGGGGGSGGAIRIQALGSIVNNGSLLIAGGIGGAGSSPGGKGGDGSAGLFELEDSDNVIEGSGTGAIGLPTLHSAISCGTVKVNEQQNLFFQMIAGFMLVILVSKIRGRFRHSV